MGQRIEQDLTAVAASARSGCPARSAFPCA